MPEHSSHRKASAKKELQAFYIRLLTGMKRMKCGTVPISKPPDSPATLRRGHATY